MPTPISIPPLIPLPVGTGQSTGTHDPQDDLFATLFSPSTPRASPTHELISDEDSAATSRPKLRHSHSRTSSVDSDFGSFISVPSTEDPLHQISSTSVSSPFSPLQNFEFFDRFTEEAKAATEKNKKGLLDELLHHEEDPLYFLRSDTPASQQAHGTQEHSIQATASRPNPSVGLAPASQASTTLVEDLPTQPLISLDESSGSDAWDIGRLQSSNPPLLTPSPSASSSTSRKATPEPAKGLLHELLTYEDEPMYFHASTSASTSRTSTPQPPPSNESKSTRSPRYPSRDFDWIEPQEMRSPDHPTRSPSLPPSSTRLSYPEVQKAQSYFMPTSFTTSSFPKKWVSSLLSRPAPSVGHPPTPPTESGFDGMPAHGRAATIPGASPITHGTPFAAHTYVPPSGAPGFAGDRAWNKGFEFDKENVERASVKLVGRKEGTNGILAATLADQLRPHLPALKRLPRSWTLLYSLDQHGISLNTLYTRCESHAGGALVVMRDSNDAVFGAWMGEGIHMSKGAYYGSGESFLWKLLPDDKLRVYKWTGRNDYVALCEPEYISFGGGEGHYGLYLDETLSDGSSARCSTFDNEPLCSAGPRQGEGVTFECVGLEVWGIGG